MENYGNRAVSIEAAAKAVKAAAEGLQDPTKPGARADILKPFIFSIIVSITSEDFFASSCGKWKGPTIAAQTFANVKLTFTGEAPADPLLAEEFHHSCAKISQMFALAKTSEAHERRGVFVESGDKIKLRFTHRLFEELKDGEEDDDADVPAAFKIHQWPVRHEEARKAINGMKSTHRVNYLRAYDASPEGRLLFPGAYDSQLPGALAQIRFTLSHWNICQSGQNPRDVFNANIEHIRILNPPRTASPSKRRKFSAIDDVSGDISPKKARPASGP